MEDLMRNIDLLELESYVLRNDYNEKVYNALQEYGEQEVKDRKTNGVAALLGKEMGKFCKLYVYAIKIGENGRPMVKVSQKEPVLYGQNKDNGNSNWEFLDKYGLIPADVAPHILWNVERK